MKLLTASVGSAAACLAAGLLLWTPEPGGARGGLLDAGLILLMATPALRVALAIREFAQVRDWAFTAVALAVLVFLLASLVYSVAAA